MKAVEIAEILQAAPITYWEEEDRNRDYEAAFASDLMSDVLMFVQTNPETTVLITGLANAQTLRTVEMMDMRFVVFVRGKFPSDETIELARNMGITMLASDLTMFEACGVLYQKGLGGIYGSRTA